MGMMSSQTGDLRAFPLTKFSTRSMRLALRFVYHAAATTAIVRRAIARDNQLLRRVVVPPQTVILVVLSYNCADNYSQLLDCLLTRAPAERNGRFARDELRARSHTMHHFIADQSAISPATTSRRRNYWDCRNTSESNAPLPLSSSDRVNLHPARPRCCVSIM